MVALGGREAELGEDRADVLLDGPLGDDEPRGDRAVRAALGHQREHLTLARAEIVERVAAAGAGEELADHLGVDRGAAGGDPVDGLEEVARLGHAVLEQVPDTARIASEQLARVALLDVLREDEHRERRVTIAQLECGAHPLVGEGRRHADVDDRDLGRLPRDGGEQLDGIARGCRPPRAPARRADG